MRKILESVWWQVYVWWWAILSYSHFDKNSGTLEFLVLPAFFFNLQFFLCVFLFYVQFSLSTFVISIPLCIFRFESLGPGFFNFNFVIWKNWQRKIKNQKKSLELTVEKHILPKILQIFSKKHKKTLTGPFFMRHG